MTDHDLHYAAEEGYFEAVRDFVEDDPTLLDIRAEHGGTPLMFAAFGGQKDIVQYLLGKKARVDSTSEGGFTALYWACHRGFKDIALILIEAGATDQALTNGRTPLIDAVAEGHTAVVEALVEHRVKLGMDIDAVDENGRSALHIARALNKAIIEEILLEAGANPDLFEAGRPPSPAPTSFYVARRGLGKKVLSRGSLSTGDISRALSATSLRELAQIDDKADHVLHRAAEFGHLEVVKKWVELDPRMLSKRGEHGGTPLMFAAFGGHMEIVQYLVDRKARVDEREEGGYTPVYWACHRGHADIVRYLIKKGADPTVALDDGRTPLMDAVAEGNTDVIKVLLEQGNLRSSDIDAVDKTGRSALFMARSMGRVDAERLLLAAGSNPALGRRLPSNDNISSLVF